MTRRPPSLSIVSGTAGATTSPWLLRCLEWSLAVGSPSKWRRYLPLQLAAMRCMVYRLGSSCSHLPTATSEDRNDSSTFSSVIEASSYSSVSRGLLHEAHHTYRTKGITNLLKQLSMSSMCPLTLQDRPPRIDPSQSRFRTKVYLLSSKPPDRCVGDDSTRRSVSQPQIWPAQRVTSPLQMNLDLLSIPQVTVLSLKRLSQ